MPTMKVWDGSTWIQIDAKNSLQLGGIDASGYSLISHTHTAAQVGAVANAGGLPSILVGNTSSRPAASAGTIGRIYLDTQTKKFFRDTGTAWDLVGGGDAVDWSQILNKPVTFPPSVHTHDGADITVGTIIPAVLPNATTAVKGAVQLSIALNSTSTATAPTSSALKTTYDAAVGAQTTADSKSPLGHIHDDRYYTEAEMDALLAGKSAITHTHDTRYYTQAQTDSFLAAKLGLTAKAADSNLLDGLDSLQFARVDVNQDRNARENFNTANGRLVVPVGVNKYAT
jgi:hypothetical protein